MRLWHELTGEAALGRWRLATGLVLFSFVVTHFLNHALGLASLALLEQGREVIDALWRFPPLEVLLLGSLVLHPVLALVKLWRRRTLRMTLLGATQLGLGLLIPLWLTVHVLAMGVVNRRLGYESSYHLLFDVVWPGGWLAYTLMMSLVWLHGCIGVHRWLRLKSWYNRTRAPALALAVLLPVLAWLGFVEGGRTFQAMRQDDPAWRDRLAMEQNWPDQTERDANIFVLERAILLGFKITLGLMAAGALVRWFVARRSRVAITYDGGQTISVAKGMTLLEASRSAGIPHAAVCGGRGRCSTCRVRITKGLDRLALPEAGERRVLERIHADPDIRLACQIRPAHPLSVIRLLPPRPSADQLLSPVDPGLGREQVVAVLFADLRGFTRLAEMQLPYDTVYVLNRYFAAMGTAIEQAGGRVDKFIGDGIMALFGLEENGKAGARHALLAARAMAQALEGLNKELSSDLKQPLRIGIGIHCGPAIVGEMGWNRATSLTAVGDTVNVASRLEALTKEQAVQLVLSDDVVTWAGVPFNFGQSREIDIRGRSGVLKIWLVKDASVLAIGPDERTSQPPGPFWRRLFAPAEGHP